jgi:hypothetical protein
MIVYGWSSFKIHSAPIHQYPFGQNFAPGIEVEIRQKYAHIFWIPFFSIGKIWALKQNGQMFEMSNDVKQALIQYGVKTKTPWYSFIGLILVGAGLLIALISGMVSQHKRQSDFEQFQQEMAAYPEEEKLQTPQAERSKYMEFTDAQIGDILMFTDEKNASVAVQVYEANADDYELLIPYPELSGHSINDAGLAEYFYDSTTAVRRVRVSKESISNTVDRSDGSQTFAGAKVEEFSHLTKLPLTAWKVEHPTVEVDSNQ